MSSFVKLNLEYASNKYLHLNRDYLIPYERELVSFLEGFDYMRTVEFAKNTMFSQEIKANNTIEGLNDDLNVIDEVIKRKKTTVSEMERRRISNLYHGYQYILDHKTIDKEHLRELYSILSSGILEPYDLKATGPYYRTDTVYILRGNHLDGRTYTGVDVDKINYYMEELFEYINDKETDASEIDIFIKSQVIHYYFVYIHPYMDGNGRTSRTLAMWYLLNNKIYPYIIFNRAIVFAKREYEANIIKARAHGDLTLFLKYMLIHVEKELEKEYFIHSIRKREDISLSKEESQILEYFLEMKGNLTANDLAILYNRYNEPRRPYTLFKEKIVPLLEKGILVNEGYTNGSISSNQKNLYLKINRDIIEVNPSKVKHLSLERYIK